MSACLKIILKSDSTVCSIWDKGYRYGFNGMEHDKDIGSDDYDFGARIYDGRIGRWLSLDPLMMKYPDIGPYVGIGDNPLIFIDPDGKILKIVGDNGTYTYSNGKLLNADGKEADVSTDKYASTVLSQIGQLCQTTTGAKAVLYLEVANETTSILAFDGDKNNENKCVNNSDNSISIYFDPYNNLDMVTTAGVNDPTQPFIVLGHEMAHGISSLSGNQDGNTWFTFEGNNLTNDEKYASNIENLIRKESFNVLRTYYGTDSKTVSIGGVDTQVTIPLEVSKIPTLENVNIPLNRKEIEVKNENERILEEKNMRLPLCPLKKINTNEVKVNIKIEKLKIIKNK